MIIARDCREVAGNGSRVSTFQSGSVKLVDNSDDEIV